MSPKEALHVPSSSSAALAPGRGWRDASVLRRVLAVIGGVLLLPVLLGGTGITALDESSSLVGASVVLPPVLLHALARVLRPHLPDATTPDRVRHALAATGTGLSWSLVSTLARVAQDDLPAERVDHALLSASALLGVPALALGGITLLWGVISAAERARRARAA